MKIEDLAVLLTTMNMITDDNYDGATTCMYNASPPAALVHLLLCSSAQGSDPNTIAFFIAGPSRDKVGVSTSEPIALFRLAIATRRALSHIV